MGTAGKHEWSFGKRGLGMTQEGLGALLGLGIRAGRAELRWNKASTLMRRKTSTHMVNLNYSFTHSATASGLLFKNIQNGGRIKGEGKHRGHARTQPQVKL